jgi:hypothetical protein
VLRNPWFPRIVLTALGMLAAAQLWAFPDFARQTKAACVACHVNPAGGADLNDAGKAFKTDAKAPAASTAKAAEYIGSNKCKMCHINEYKGWAATVHAKSLTNLQAVSAEKAAEVAGKLKVELKGTAATTDGCVKCHVTGFKLAGGYPAADSTKNAAASAVACEGCHGPGSLHMTAPMAEKKKFISRTVSAKMCEQCHNATMSPEFKYEEFVTKGVHPIKKASG